MALIMLLGMADAFAQAQQATTKVPVFRSPPLPAVVRPPRPTAGQQSAAEWQRKQEQAAKEEARKQEQANKTEQRKRERAEQEAARAKQRQERAEAQEHERERVKVEREEKARAERQVKYWSKPRSPEEAAEFDAIRSERRQRMEERQQREEERSRRQEAGCAIAPVMTDEEIARCR